MLKKIIFSFLFLALIIFLVFFFLSSIEGQNNESELFQDIDADSKIVIFYGNDCPNCVIVDNHINANRLDSSLNLVRKEVYQNIVNLEEMEIKIKECNPQPRIRGVPFLWDNGLCLVGDRDIINYLNFKAGR